MFEVYYVNRFYPGKEIFYGRFETEIEAREFCISNNAYTRFHGCHYWVEDLI